MIYLFTIVEKILERKQFKTQLAEDKQQKAYHLLIVQRYISWLGPWLPTSPKRVKLMDAAQHEVPTAAWTPDVKERAAVLKHSVPFQAGFFRNTFLLIGLLILLSLVIPQINKARSRKEEERSKALYAHLSALQSGDKLRVSFISDASGLPASGVGLLKITRINADTVFAVRSQKTVPYTMKNTGKALLLRRFGKKEERIVKPILDQHPEERLLLGYSPGPEGANYTIGTVLQFED